MTSRGKTTLDLFLWWLLAAAAVAIPLVVTPGKDQFRLPRELLLDAVAIAAAALAIVGVIWSRTDIPARLASHRRTLLIAAAALGWTAVTAAASTQRLLSLYSLIWVACAAAFFVVVLGLAKERPLWSIWLLIVPAIINTAVAILQRTEIWNPFIYPDPLAVRLRTTGLFGNPNDLGSFLLLPAVAAMAAATVTRGWMRIVSAVAAAALVLGIAVAEALTALSAVIAAALALAFLVTRRAAARLAAVAAVVVIVAIVVKLPVVTRIVNVSSEVRAGRTFEATSLRPQAMYAAALMAKEHPLTGVGPGCYGFWYLPYKMELIGRHPEYMTSTENFHEVHNDHLQILATMGLPGYVIFLAALWQVARISFGAPPDGDARARFARRFAFPAAAAFFVLALGQFPLELAAPAMSALVLGALTLSWGSAG
jgi:O-antigen ligase